MTVDVMTVNMSWVDLIFAEAVEVDLREDMWPGLGIAVEPLVENSEVVSKPHLMLAELPARNLRERLLAAIAADRIFHMCSEISEEGTTDVQERLAFHFGSFGLLVHYTVCCSLVPLK